MPRASRSAAGRSSPRSSRRRRGCAGGRGPRSGGACRGARSRRSTGRASMGDLRLFFATDIDGSERCFRKFLNAGSFYGADVLVMGGDMTGKMLLPIVALADGRYAATISGRERVVDADE